VYAVDAENRTGEDLQVISSAIKKTSTKRKSSPDAGQLRPFGTTMCE
jgi:hypothetical protein